MRSSTEGERRRDAGGGCSAWCVGGFVASTAPDGRDTVAAVASVPSVGRARRVRWHPPPPPPGETMPASLYRAVSVSPWRCLRCDGVLVANTGCVYLADRGVALVTTSAGGLVP